MNYAKLVERHIESGADLTVGTLPVGVSRGGRAVRRRRGRRRQPRGRVRGEAAAPQADPRRSAPGLGLDGHLRQQRPLPLRAALPRRHPARQPARLRPRHHPGHGRVAPRVRLSVHGREPEDGGLLARRGHAGRLLRRQHGPGLRRSAVEHVRRRLADPHLPAEPAAAEVRLCREGAGRPLRPGAGQHRLPGLHRLRRPVGADDPRPRLPHQQLRRR